MKSIPIDFKEFSKSVFAIIQMQNSSNENLIDKSLTNKLQEAYDKNILKDVFKYSINFFGEKIYKNPNFIFFMKSMETFPINSWFPDEYLTNISTDNIHNSKEKLWCLAFKSTSGLITKEQRCDLFVKCVKDVLYEEARLCIPKLDKDIKKNLEKNEDLLDEYLPFVHFLCSYIMYSSQKSPLNKQIDFLNWINDEIGPLLTTKEQYKTKFITLRFLSSKLNDIQSTYFNIANNILTIEESELNDLNNQYEFLKKNILKLRDDINLAYWPLDSQNKIKKIFSSETPYKYITQYSFIDNVLIQQASLSKLNEKLVNNLERNNTKIKKQKI